MEKYTAKEIQEMIDKLYYTDGKQWYIPSEFPLRGSEGDWKEYLSVASYEVQKPKIDRFYADLKAEKLELFKAGMLGYNPDDYIIVNGVPVLKEDE